MRILWMSNPPFVTSGYGQQTALACKALQALGHEVTIYAYVGLQGRPMMWEGIEILPRSHEDFGLDILPGHIEYAKPDVIICLFDAWVMNAAKLKDILQLSGCRVPVLHWLPVDTDPLTINDREKFKITELSRSIVPMTEHGAACCREAGFEPLDVIPHGIDLDVFNVASEEQRRQVRADYGYPPEAFIVGINAANMDERRKAIHEQCTAFSRFHERHPESLLLLHMAENSKYGQSINAILADKHVNLKGSVLYEPGVDAVFPPQWAYAAGMLTPFNMVAWYSCLDLLSACSYGEGFGIPLIEAPACGVPVVTTDAPPMNAIVPPGSWKVACQPYFAGSVHQASWHVPFISEIEAAYESAWRKRQDTSRRPKLRQWVADRFDIRDVAARWDKLLASL